jgi:hypothetical protein
MFNRREFFNIKTASSKDKNHKLYKYITAVNCGSLGRIKYWRICKHKIIKYDDKTRHKILANIEMPFETSKIMLLVAKYIMMLKAKVAEKKIDKSAKVREIPQSVNRWSRLLPKEQKEEQIVYLPKSRLVYG